MARYRFTFLTQIQRHSFSESWYFEANNTNVNNLVPLAEQYAVARAALLGYPCYIYAFRISDVSSVVARSLLVYKTFYGNQQQDGNGNYLHGAAASNVALNCLFQNADASKEKLIQLRGIWDEEEVAGGAALQNDPVWIGLFSNYAIKVATLGFGWLGKTSGKTADIQTYTIKANGVLSFTFDPGFFDLNVTPAGTHVPIRLKGMVDSPNLNGALTVVVKSANTCDSLKPIAARAFVAGGQVSRVVNGFVPAAAGRIQRLGKRQAGAPLLQSVGRGRNRTRG